MTGLELRKNDQLVYSRPRRGAARRLSLVCRLLLVLMIFQGLLLPQRGDEPEDLDAIPLTSERIAQQKAEAEQSQDLPADILARVVGLYDGALKALDEAARFATEAERFDADAAVSEARIKALQEELDNQSSLAPVEEPQGDFTASQLEGLRTEAEAELLAARQALLDEDKLSAQRAARRRDISSRLGSLKQSLVQVNDEVRYAVEAETIPAVRTARETNLLAQARQLEAEMAALRAELKRHEARAPALPLRRDRAQRRVLNAQESVELLAAAAHEKRAEEANARLTEIRNIADQVAQDLPPLAALAGDTTMLAERLFGAAGMYASIDEASSSLTTVQRNISDVRQAFETSRRKWESVGFRGTTAQWWPSVELKGGRSDTPALLRHEIRLRESLIPEVLHQLILLEEKRAASGDIPRELAALLESIPSQVDDAERREAVALVRNLLNTRRTILDELISNTTRYSNLLYELDTTSRELLGEIENLEDFVVSRAIWIRSVPGSVAVSGANLLAGSLWLFANPSWPAVAVNVSSTAFNNPLVWLVALLLVLLFASRSFCRRQLDRIADELEERPLWRLTVAAIIFTVLLGAPVPALLLAMGALLQLVDQFEIARSVAAGLYAAGLLAAALELIACSCRRRGLAEAHFGWPADLTRPIRYNARLAEILSLAPTFITFALRDAGGSFHALPELQGWHNSLGRLCFVLATSVIAVLVCRVFRITAPALSGFVDARQWSIRYRSFGLLLVVALSLTPPLLAIFGYYLTAQFLVYFLFRSAWLALGLIFLAGLLFRWETIKRRRSSEQTSLTQQGDPARLAMADAQMRQLGRFGILVVGVLGLLTIWARFVPALQALDRVQIWPSIRIVSADQRAAPRATLDSSMAAGSVNIEESSQGPESEQAAPPMPPSAGAVSLLAPSTVQATSGGSGGSAAAGSDETLTLTDLLTAMIILLATVVTAKNIPGLLEFSVLPRIQAAVGVRIAISTLVRYAIVFVGLGMTFSVLGIQWSSIQWLAAALTFGLAFGLQEIFANFVSGLILLTERPLRVGDFVTIGTTSGQVERIQMRATTIRAWDKSELVVPNKEFITGQLVNWTLSDSIARVEVRVGVAYGTDVGQVRDTLLQIAKRHPCVLPDPEPMAYFLEFGPSSLIFQLLVYIDFRDNRLKVRHELQADIQKTFEENEFVIALPQMDIHVKPDASPVRNKDGGS